LVRESRKPGNALSGSIDAIPDEIFRLTCEPSNCRDSLQ
jgi:hypothetical protein